MADVTIKTTKNGPLVIRGEVSVVDHNGEPFDTSQRPVVALCRCGLSKTKPFCDGAHGSAGFVAEETAG